MTIKQMPYYLEVETASEATVRTEQLSKALIRIIATMIIASAITGKEYNIDKMIQLMIQVILLTKLVQK